MLSLWNRSRAEDRSGPISQQLEQPLSPAPKKTADGQFPSVKSETGLTLFGERNYRLSFQRGSKAIRTLSERFHSPYGLEFLARQATRSKYGWVELSALLRSDSFIEVPSAWKTQDLLAACYLNCSITPVQEAFDIAIKVIKVVLAQDQIEDVTTPWSSFQAALHISVLGGDQSLRQRLSTLVDEEPDQYSLLDGERPSDWATASPEEIALWWQKFNETLTPYDLEPWDLQIPVDLDQDFFTWVHAPIVSKCTRPVTEQPLVTVIVPTYNPGPTFLQSVESLVRQSWQRLEILIMDDCSSSGQGFIEQAAATDSRIQVIRMQTNGGAYLARNAGIRAATGEFFTVLDADDLSHPRRIERQVEPLINDETLVATWTRALRLGVDGHLTTLGSHTERYNASSLLYRRTKVTEAVGYYDEVRKAADSEYQERVIAQFGKGSILTIMDPLGLIQMTVGSLSRNDFRGQWRHAFRLAYRNQYLGWHEYVLSQPDASWSPTAPGGRSFIAPQAFLGQKSASHVDVAYLSDWSARYEARELLAPTVEQLSNFTDGKIGLLNGFNLRLSSPQRHNSSSSVWRLVEEERATWLSWGQNLKIDTLVVPNPSFLLFLPIDTDVSLQVDRVVIAVDRLTSRRTHGGSMNNGILNPAWIEEHCLRTFGKLPHWLPATKYLSTVIGDVRGTVLEPGILRASTFTPMSAESLDLTRPESVEVLRAGRDLRDLAPTQVWEMLAQRRLVVTPRSHRGTYGKSVTTFPRATFENDVAELLEDSEAQAALYEAAVQHTAEITSPENLHKVLQNALGGKSFDDVTTEPRTKRFSFRRHSGF
ncbi:hypothetical protein JOF28_001321 [Leucobacter exalbidus]|uniref:Glycosyltransferase 2-like domain-containing protein n=1 Tax=Leucobacter exalbidus TaxID=662960 RepID=A0A940PR78_9MICO|nr:glycosyltransferase family A protein [Leucobacter exalbidus]MBP1326089.1 hypothetical protein [Leucobacter exalbidus]